MLFLVYQNRELILWVFWHVPIAQRKFPLLYYTKSDELYDLIMQQSSVAVRDMSLFLSAPSSNFRKTVRLFSK